jgi:hypothetical protein
MMPRSEHRVLASNQIIAPNQAEQNYQNKYGDTIKYTYLGMGIVRGHWINRCTALAKTGEQVKLLKSYQAAVNFINKIRGEETTFQEA